MQKSSASCRYKCSRALCHSTNGCVAPRLWPCCKYTKFSCPFHGVGCFVGRWRCIFQEHISTRIAYRGGMHPVRLPSLLPSGAPDLRRKYFCVRRTVGCELSSLHLQRARRRFVSCSDRPRCLCLRRRTYSGTTWMMANPWTSQHRCNRRCSSTRKIYGLDSVVYFFYYLSIYLPSFWIPLFVQVMCCAVAVYMYLCLCLATALFLFLFSVRSAVAARICK
jgi:hypothetical protein